MPDHLYRYGPYEALVQKEAFEGDVMGVLGPLRTTTGNRQAAEDTEAFLGFLDSFTGLTRHGERVRFTLRST